MYSASRRCLTLLQGNHVQPEAPVMLRGQTKSELEATFLQACQEADPQHTGDISWQVGPTILAVVNPCSHICSVRIRDLFNQPRWEQPELSRVLGSAAGS